MILLELTEAEAEAALELIRIGVLNFPTEKYTAAEREKISIRAANVCDKMIAATKPQSDHPIAIKDLFFIKSLAKDEYHKLRGDLHISNKKVEETDFMHISLVSATIMWLNSRNCLKRLATFDFTDHSSEFEEMDE